MLLIDLTRLLQNEMPVFPGDSPMSLRRTHQVTEDGFCNHDLKINMHTGTHIDGPMHLTDSELQIGDIPLDRLIGRGCVLDVSDQAEIDYEPEYELLVEDRCILLLHTGHSALFGHERYFSDYPVLTESFAEFLVRKSIKLVGLDSPSPDQAPYPVHRILMNNGILIAENLTNLDRLLDLSVPFEVIALPLSIEADSAPARVIARAENF